ncbi:MAG: helix-turn-helix transcriptional regulator [Eubacterium sp.]|nr:helix-turn-helix transcriptional regulator [Eubacterium sp.]MBR7073360.1 helix-turn-helix transcriptional regulator [Eubacterium sp.]
MTEKALGVRLNIKKNLKRLREANGLKMRDLAIVLGIKENTYRVWEDRSKETVPKADGLVEIAKIFNVSLDFLVNNVEDNIRKEGLLLSSGSNDSFYGDKYLNELSAEEKRSIMKMRRMVNSDRQRVMELIDEILDNNSVKLD